ncbi:PH domain-containing protein [Lacticaseibacillus baoqingensis]|uniref:PH domain-containing protein n=1 Tax=Lacticaseibacillus baoqingensis TaxID=2486013 RepID=A0ABW4EAJ8_9LACO|nr:PH domain-containing protein [Lacticaseibacillus baoqingensis]
MPKRLPLLALPLMLIQELRTWLFLLGLIIINTWQSHFAWYNLLALAAVLAGSLLLVGIRYWRFTYLLAPQQLTITSGLFIRKVRHIPYANIQTLHRQQWFYLRPFGLETLNVETSSQDGKNGAATLFAVPLSVAADIEAHRQHQPKSAPAAQQPTAAVPAQADLTYQIAPKDLNLYALTSLGFLPLLAVIFGAYGKLDDLIPDAWQARVFSSLAHLALLVIVGLGLFFLLVAIFASYLNLMQKYYHFTLTQTGDTLVTTRGFFKRTTVSVQRDRIQAARIRQSLLRQGLHLATVQALVASNAADDESDHDLVLMPVVPFAQTWPTMHPFIPWLPAAAPALNAIPANSRWYYIRNLLIGNGIVLAALLVPLAYFWSQWLWLGGFIAGIWLVLAALQGRYAANNAGVAIIDEHRLAVQTGSWWTRTQYVVRRENIQSLALSNSIWLAPKHRCHLSLNIRSGDNNQQVVVRYLDRAMGQAVRDWYQPADTSQHF